MELPDVTLGSLLCDGDDVIADDGIMINASTTTNIAAIRIFADLPDNGSPQEMEFRQNKRTGEECFEIVPNCVEG